MSKHFAVAFAKSSEHYSRPPSDVVNKVVDAGYKLEMQLLNMIGAYFTLDIHPWILHYSTEFSCRICIQSRQPGRAHINRAEGEGHRGGRHPEESPCK